MNPALIVPLALSGTGVALAALAYLNRDNPRWQGSLRGVFAVAVGQVLLGAVTWLILNSRH